MVRVMAACHLTTENISETELVSKDQIACTGLGEMEHQFKLQMTS